MENFEIIKLRKQLSERRNRLTKAIENLNSPQYLIMLLQKVDSALERMDNGTFGICEVCKEPIENERILANPLITFCLDHLTNNERKILEQDLDLASKIQGKLLPKNNCSEFNFEVSYHYQPAGLVSGDYCDIILNDNDRSIIFLVGDITGKGIAASMLMTHVHALVHSLISFNLPLSELMEKVNRLFCESSLYTYFITMILGKVSEDGKVEICNAGHCLPIVIKKNEIKSIDSTGLPLGIFQTVSYTTLELKLEIGDGILLYTDGLSEANNGSEEFGEERINRIALENYNAAPDKLLNLILSDLNEFTHNKNLYDDLTIMSIRKYN